jgi:hypothetical protein
VPDAVLFDLFGHLFGVIARHQSPAGQDRLTTTAGGAGPGTLGDLTGTSSPYDPGEVAGPDYCRQAADLRGTRFDDRRVADLIEADIAPAGTPSVVLGVVGKCCDVAPSHLQRDRPNVVEVTPYRGGTH